MVQANVPKFAVFSYQKMNQPVLDAVGVILSVIAKKKKKKFDEDVAAATTNSLPEWVGRLEFLMETCLQTLMEVRQNKNDTIYDVLTPSSSTTSKVHETVPVLSLFSNDLLRNVYLPRLYICGWLIISAYQGPVFSSCFLLSASDPLPSQYEPPIHFQTMAVTAQLFLA
jgi:hypothetical protein